MTDPDYKTASDKEGLGEPLPDIDPEFSLSDLLSVRDVERLQAKLTVLLGADAQIIDVDKLQDNHERSYPVRYQICPVAYLVTEAPPQSAKAATDILESVLYQASRYRLAAVAHHAIVLQDFDDLQTKHERLLESEAKYRDLAIQLEQRVKDQVDQIELRQRQVYEAEKLSALAQLGAGVAHEINNPLGFIQSNMNTGKTYIQDIMDALASLRQGESMEKVVESFDLDFVLDDLQTLMTETIDGVSRVSRIVKDLKGFVSAGTSTRQPIMMNEVLDSICNLSHPLLHENILITRDYGKVSPTLADKAALCQALYAIFLNAIQSIENEGNILIKCHEDNQTIFIRIEDSGSGMDAATLTRIYEPFYTTKPVGTGTGLGLTVCRDIVRAHQGEIRVTSSPGEGTQVRISLPVLT